MDTGNLLFRVGLLRFLSLFFSEFLRVLADKRLELQLRTWRILSLVIAWVMSIRCVLLLLNFRIHRAFFQWELSSWRLRWWYSVCRCYTSIIASR